MRKRKALCQAVLSAVVVVSVLGLGAFWVVAGQFVAPHRSNIGPAPSDFPAESISLESKTGATVSGWHQRAKDGRGVIVLVHGIGASRLSMLTRARMLGGLGYSTVLIDLQAHGESSGERITLGYLEKEDVRAAVEFARRHHPDEPIGVIGVSLGGASAALGAPLGVNAMVLESVYPTIDEAVRNRVRARVGAFHSLPTFLLLAQLQWRLGVAPEALRPIEQVARVDCPLLVVSGTDDAHTTASETRAMFAAAIEPKELWLVEGAGHVDLERVNPVEYQARIAKFLEKSFISHGRRHGVSF